MSSPFDPEALQLAVQRHLAEIPIPEGKRGAFVTIGNQEGVKAAIAIRVGDSWSVGAFCDVERKPDDPGQWGVDYGVHVRGTF